MLLAGERVIYPPTPMKPLVRALGINPAFWAVFTFISKPVWWEEKRSHDPEYRGTRFRKSRLGVK